ncbi:ribosome small subunit-dependent GTPase A [Candidatus Poriferisodalis sp.]|uniref:ribosome small subunit-dependent GTPase A n=1 Tax=Candidatus Poriferisodalis sp. TaxID=3101277 RepID=UPI003B02CC17
MSDATEAPLPPAADLGQLGWLRRSGRDPRTPSGHVISRIAVTHRGAYELADERGGMRAALDAAVRDAARSPLDYPTVGDWVVRSREPRHNQRVVITEVLERTSLLCRRAVGPRVQPQLVAANADVLAIVTTPDERASIGTNDAASIGRRIEWYLTAAFSGGVRPVIVVNKTDTVSNAKREAIVSALRRRLGAAAADVPILATSAVDGRGLDELGALTADGATVALSGPSGVGKSSLANRLAGADMVPVAPLSPDGRGRHTTVRRQLVAVGDAAGGTLVDTPGLQDLIPWGGSLGLRHSVGTHDGVALTFSDIAEFARRCRFADCAHTIEPDCAVVAAAEAGRLPAERLSTYRELVADMAAIELYGSSKATGPR